jgi:hypothetical protein
VEVKMLFEQISPGIGKKTLPYFRSNLFQSIFGNLNVGHRYNTGV